MPKFKDYRDWAQTNLPTGERWSKIKQYVVLAIAIILILILAEIFTVGLVAGIIFGVIALTIGVPLVALAVTNWTAPPPPAAPSRSESLAADAGRLVRAFAWTMDNGGRVANGIYNWRWEIGAVFTTGGVFAIFGTITGAISGSAVWLTGYYRNNRDNFNVVARLVALVLVLFFFGFIPGGLVGLGLALICTATTGHYAANQIKVITEMYNRDFNQAALSATALSATAPSATAPAVAPSASNPAPAAALSASALPPNEERPWWKFWK